MGGFERLQLVAAACLPGSQPGTTPHQHGPGCNTPPLRQGSPAFLGSVFMQNSAEQCVHR